MPPTVNKTILTASFIETTSEPSGVSRVTKNKSPKSDPITEFSTGHSSDSSEPSIPAASEEVSNLKFIPSQKEGYFLLMIKINNVGFQVFSRNCGNCHGMIAKKYDLLLDKVYEQL